MSDDFNSSDNGGDNPAWNDFLSVIPEDYHEAVKPHLQQWDSGVQQKINGVHSQYEPYKPFLEQKVSPDDLKMGYGLLQAVHKNPAEVVNAIRQTFNLMEEQQGSVNNNEEDPFEDLPQAVKDKLALVDKLQSGYETMGQALQRQQQEALERQEGEKLAIQMNELREKYGEFDEEFVLNFMLNGAKAEDAVIRYHQMVDNIRSQSNRPPVPRLLGPGGSNGIPGNKVVDPRKMDSKGTRDLVSQMLEEAARQKNG